MMSTIPQSNFSLESLASLYYFLRIPFIRQSDTLLIALPLFLITWFHHPRSCLALSANSEI